jgi:hypothetical protein
VITIELGRDRRHLGLGEFPDCIADKLLLIGQLEVHGKIPS